MLFDKERTAEIQKSLNTELLLLQNKKIFQLKSYGHGHVIKQNARGKISHTGLLAQAKIMGKDQS